MCNFSEEFLWYGIVSTTLELICFVSPPLAPLSLRWIIQRHSPAYSTLGAATKLYGVGKCISSLATKPPRATHRTTPLPHCPITSPNLHRTTPSALHFLLSEEQKQSKTYSSGYSHVVTHRSTSPPVRSLSTGERTGSSVLCDLWPYVKARACNDPYIGYQWSAERRQELVEWLDT